MRVFTLLLCLTLSACGWQLRGEVAPLMLDTVMLRGAEARTHCYATESGALVEAYCGRGCAGALSGRGTTL